MIEEHENIVSHIIMYSELFTILEFIGFQDLVTFPTWIEGVMNAQKVNSTK